ncbi:ABC transporter permease [Cohnella herbarum]|uniref:Sugar ABC transporter permease n=1 Tax=Cohnella herbarum TaxID=2728023 RepID=A0A7Z2ZQ85_9BACL|nr:ABC transporter permease subunit [Cohnella herbarum]QJD86767.1 sugar ABC transporter permease [Cohnella herbarum]
MAIQTSIDRTVYADKGVKPLAFKQRGLSRFVRNLISYKALYLMFIPGLLVLLVNNYLPIFGVFVAFKDVNYIDGIFGSPWVGFHNFEFLFSNDDAIRAVRNTVLYSVTFMSLTTVFAVTVSLLFNELRSRLFAKLYQSLMILPYFLSMVVVSYLVLAFLSPQGGFINTILRSMGIAEIDWYSSSEYWPTIFVLITLWKNIGYSAVVYIAGMAGIDPEYYEAAVIDGASRWQQAKSITLPMIRPLIIILTLLSMANIFVSDFGLFYQVTLNSGILYDTTDVIDTFVYRSLINLNDIGMSSAAALVQSTVGFVLVLSSNAVVRKISKEDSLF